MSIQYIRGLVRPVVTLLLVAATVVFVAQQIPLPDRFWDLTIAASAFWFGSRIAAKEQP